MTAPIRTPAPAPSWKIPPLRPGDRLTADEFERRYEAMPHLKKAELIEGVVYMQLAVSTDWHAAPHFDFIGWLTIYRAYAPGVQGGDNGTLRLDLRNRPQPDAFLRILPAYGGQSETSTEGYVVRAPELAAEVAASSVSYDLHDKLEAYRRNGVREYIVWRVEDRGIDWFVLRNGQYEKLQPAPSGWLQSEVFPGLWLDAGALLRGDLTQVLQVAQQGVQSPEHVAFVNHLRHQAGLTS
jgi:Uma2 family endonuclease